MERDAIIEQVSPERAVPPAAAERPGPRARPDRAAASLLAVTGLLLLRSATELADAAAYLALLATLGGALCLATAWRLWVSGSLTARAIAAFVVGLAISGQALALTLGLPGAGAPSDVDVPRLVLLTVEAATLALLAGSGLVRSAESGVRRLYAP